MEPEKLLPAEREKFLHDLASTLMALRTAKDIVQNGNECRADIIELLDISCERLSMLSGYIKKQQ